MIDLPAIAVNTLAVALVPLFGWISQRWTREARLSIRVSRLGGLLSVVPESDQRNALEAHVLAATEELNNWLDPLNRGVREAQTGISVAMLAVGLTLVVWLENAVQLEPAVSLATSVAIGALIAIASVGVGSALQKLFVRRRLSQQQSERFRKLRAGEHPL